VKIEKMYGQVDAVYSVYGGNAFFCGLDGSAGSPVMKLSDIPVVPIRPMVTVATIVLALPEICFLMPAVVEPLPSELP
jgi:hypothetical protein